MSKTNPENPETVERFQSVIAGSELGNGFSELNDPIDQLNRFLEQQQMRDAGDEEAMMLDIDYVEMLEYGMPPACGWGYSEGYSGFSRALQRVKVCHSHSLRAKLTKQLGQFIRKSTCNFAIIKA